MANEGRAPPGEKELGTSKKQAACMKTAYFDQEEKVCNRTDGNACYLSS